MKKTTYFLLGILFFCSAFAEDAFKTESTLYKVYKKGENDTSYIFGTVHLVPKKQFEIPDVLLGKFDQCETLLMELDLNLSLKEQLSIMQNAVLPAGKTIENYMHPDSFNLLHTYFLDTLGIKEKKLQKYYRFEPFFIHSFIFKDYYGKIESYEDFFNKRAKKKEMKIAGLESWEFQFSLVDSMGINAQLELLTTDIIDEYEMLLDYYLTNNFDKVEEMLASELESDFEEQFLKRRNETWVPALVDYLNEGSVFIAVGAAHILGDKGLLKSLQDNGFVIEAVIL